MSISKIPTPRLPRASAQYTASQQTLFVDAVERHFDLIRGQLSALIDAVNGREDTAEIADAVVTLATVYIGYVVETTGASPSIAVPSELSVGGDLGTGCRIRGVHSGTGNATFTGVTFVHPTSVSPTVPPGGSWTLLKLPSAPDKWALTGDLI
jgi:hypothetical protein